MLDEHGGTVRSRRLLSTWIDHAKGAGVKAVTIQEGPRGLLRGAEGRCGSRDRCGGAAEECTGCGGATGAQDLRTDWLPLGGPGEPVEQERRSAASVDSGEGCSSGRTGTFSRSCSSAASKTWLASRPPYVTAFKDYPDVLICLLTEVQRTLMNQSLSALGSGPSVVQAAVCGGDSHESGSLACLRRVCEGGVGAPLAQTRRGAHPPPPSVPSSASPPGIVVQPVYLHDQQHLAQRQYHRLQTRWGHPDVTE